ncbi:phosphotransferase [Actinoplanes sp. NEAU-A12]|uniref:Phosphotransferase n=1 Tax=Actinoplanes sandaracinus TaxID=3045177 RepID=A0ABT6WP60_9ACTN|nr:phosphotransferase [Actinoplanes sandaracinus]MDI6101506.1 phosphotransferase [Actinoplanes sandaracinus]
MSRDVSLVLADPAGRLLGALPPFTVETPWWQEVAEVVAGAGIDVTVLRLLHGDRPAPPGGHVTYLAVTSATPAGLIPVEAALERHPRRAPYAEFGGPEASLAWAAGALDRIGLSGTTARQQRTWNLSAIWRFDDPAGTPVAWLKQVPPFFAHEAAVLRSVDAVSPGLVPYPMAVGEQGRMLLAHVPGEDRYGAGPALCADVVNAFHPVQRHFAGRVEELRAAGVPDLSLDGILRVAEPHLGVIPGLAKLLDDLPRRLAEVEGCGLPDTLVHGDLHPGNVRTGDDGSLTIVDWADSAIGNPAFDALRLCDDAGVLAGWAALWPDGDALRAVELLRPVAALRAAVVYAGFLEKIEPAEWPYHADDVPAALREAAGSGSVS